MASELDDGIGGFNVTHANLVRAAVSQGRSLSLGCAGCRILHAPSATATIAYWPFRSCYWFSCLGQIGLLCSHSDAATSAGTTDRTLPSVSSPIRNLGPIIGISRSRVGPTSDILGVNRGKAYYFPGKSEAMMVLDHVFLHGCFGILREVILKNGLNGIGMRVANAGNEGRVRLTR